MNAHLSRRFISSSLSLLRPSSSHSPIIIPFRHYAVIEDAPITFRKPRKTDTDTEEPSKYLTLPTHLPQLAGNLRYKIKNPNVEYKTEEYDQPLGGTEKLPFHFHRSPSNRLPIYSEIKGNRVFTVVRKFEGDIKELSKEISLLIPEAEITEKAGSLLIRGKHQQALRHWLKLLGF